MWAIFFGAIVGNIQWTFDSILFRVPWSSNYFWFLTIWSLLMWLLEIYFPWRQKHTVYRKDFGLDALYMYWNFFGFTAVFSGFLAVIAHLLEKQATQIQELAFVDISESSVFFQLLMLLCVSDFLQYCTHRLLHRVDFLWRFHQIHHSVQEMGFAAHLRYHWMETLIYHPVKYAALVILGGVEPQYAYIVYFFTLMIGHLNHSNIYWTWGPFQYILNSPVQHFWHHTYKRSFRNEQCNFAITLSCWDWLFGVFENQVPNPNMRLGFDGDESVPSSFVGQITYGYTFSSNKRT